MRRCRRTRCSVGLRSGGSGGQSSLPPSLQIRCRSQAAWGVLSFRKKQLASLRHLFSCRKAPPYPLALWAWWERHSVLENKQEGFMKARTCWEAVCTVDDLVADSGIAVWTEDGPVAVFYLPHRLPALFAISHTDPFSGSNVLARGIRGDWTGCHWGLWRCLSKHFVLG